MRICGYEWLCGAKKRERAQTKDEFWIICEQKDLGVSIGRNRSGYQEPDNKEYCNPKEELRESFSFSLIIVLPIPISCTTAATDIECSRKEAEGKRAKTEGDL